MHLPQGIQASPLPHRCCPFPDFLFHLIQQRALQDRWRAPHAPRPHYHSPGTIVRLIDNSLLLRKRTAELPQRTQQEVIELAVAGNRRDMRRDGTARIGRCLFVTPQAIAGFRKIARCQRLFALLPCLLHQHFIISHELFAHAHRTVARMTQQKMTVDSARRGHASRPHIDERLMNRAAIAVTRPMPPEPQHLAPRNLKLLGIRIDLDARHQHALDLRLFC